jgi:hypothetical protein
MELDEQPYLLITNGMRQDIDKHNAMHDGYANNKDEHR